MVSKALVLFILGKYDSSSIREEVFDGVDSLSYFNLTDWEYQTLEFDTTTAIKLAKKLQNIGIDLNLENVLKPSLVDFFKEADKKYNAFINNEKRYLPVFYINGIKHARKDLITTNKTLLFNYIASVPFSNLKDKNPVFHSYIGTNWVIEKLNRLSVSSYETFSFVVYELNGWDDYYEFKELPIEKKEFIKIFPKL